MCIKKYREHVRHSKLFDFFFFWIRFDSTDLIAWTLSNKPYNINKTSVCYFKSQVKSSWGNRYILYCYQGKYLHVIRLYIYFFNFILFLNFTKKDFSNSYYRNAQRASISLKVVLSQSNWILKLFYNQGFTVPLA